MMRTRRRLIRFRGRRCLLAEFVFGEANEAISNFSCIYITVFVLLEAGPRMMMDVTSHFVNLKL